ncbi:MAG TPA: hypothetical protein VF017_15560 [Thermoanaerobaculia bacterium]|nr:hypothetical protein [Thermoanaerobaculia bacterium]
MTPAERVVQQLSRALALDAAKTADLRPVRVVGRKDDGTLEVLRLDGECVARGDDRAAYTGQVLQSPAGPPLRYQGTAGVAGLAQSAALRAVWVRKVSPSTLERGSTTVVDVWGGGFLAETVFAYLLPGTEEEHPGVTVEAVELVDSGHVRLTVTVAPDAELVTDAALAFDNPGRPL